MMDMGPRCYLPSFMEIDQLVPEKNILKVFFTIYGRGSHFGHVTSIMLMNYHWKEGNLYEGRSTNARKIVTIFTSFDQ